MEEKRVSFATNLTYFVVIVGLVILRICSGFGLFNSFGTLGSCLLSLFTQAGIIFLLPVLLFRVLSKKRFSKEFGFFGYIKISWITVCLSVILGVVIFLLNLYVSGFFNSLISGFGYVHKSAGPVSPQPWWMLLVNLFCTAVLPAVCEETLHRGMLLYGNGWHGNGRAILISSVLFGLLHMNIEQFFYATLIGVFLAVLVGSADSIYPAMIVHFMNNALSVFFSFARSNGWGVGNLLNNFLGVMIKNGGLGIFVLLLIFVLLGCAAYHLLNAILWDRMTYPERRFRKQAKKNAKALQKGLYDAVLNDVSSPAMREAMMNALGGQEAAEDVVDFDKMAQYVQENYQKRYGEPYDEKKAKKMEIISKICLYGSFALLILTTFFTFMWGLM